MTNEEIGVLITCAAFFSLANFVADDLLPVNARILKRATTKEGRFTANVLLFLFGVPLMAWTFLTVLMRAPRFMFRGFRDLLGIRGNKLPRAKVHRT